MGGANAAVMVSFDDNGNPETEHIAGNGNVDADAVVLMCRACGSSEARRLPSATDVLAIAAASGWTTIDLPRKDMIGAGIVDWHTPARWIGHRVPDLGDDVFLRDPGVTRVNINSAAEAGSLSVRNGIALAVNASMNVDGTTALQDSGTTLELLSGGSFLTDNLRLENGTALAISGGTSTIEQRLAIDAGARLNGYGTVNVQTRLENEGTIEADGGTLRFESIAPDSVFDLDGSSNSASTTITARRGNIVFERGETVDQFAGTMTISSQRFI